MAEVAGGGGGGGSAEAAWNAALVEVVRASRAHSLLLVLRVSAPTYFKLNFWLKFVMLCWSSCRQKCVADSHAREVVRIGCCRAVASESRGVRFTNSATVLAYTVGGCSEGGAMMIVGRNSTPFKPQSCVHLSSHVHTLTLAGADVCGGRGGGGRAAARASLLRPHDYGVALRPVLAGARHGRLHGGRVSA
jgi:hypothetical protein